MDIGKMTFDLPTVISLGIYLLTAAGLYWKMRIDIAKINVAFEEIRCDRKERWLKYDKKEEGRDQHFESIMQGINNLSSDISSIKTNIDWLKKQ